jgi:chemotaxis protein methyltransferase CheR
MPATLGNELMAAYRRLLEERFGLRLSDQQSEQLDQIVPQLLMMTKYASPSELVEAFASGWRADLLRVLATSMTVGETHFYRVPAQIRALEQVVFPDLVTRHADDRRLRVWSAGCSTGEEPYTLAMLLRQHLAVPEGWDVDILATDLSQPALEAAQRATYGDWSFRDTPEEVRQRYFHQDGRRWRLHEDVVRMVRFEPLNLMADPFPSSGPFGPTLDLIVCRNVTIYFTPEATRRLYARFAEALVPGGWLLLGPSDPIPEAAELLAPVNVPGAVLWRRATPERTAAAPARAQLRPIDRVAAPRLKSDDRPRDPGLQPPAAPRRGASHGASPRSVSRRPPPLAPSGARLTRVEAERRVRDRPLDAGGYTWLGMLDLEAGAIEQAVDNLRRATFLSPEDALAQFSLGRAYARLGQSARARTALTHARRLLASMPDDQTVSGGGGIWAAELRQAVEAEFARLARTADQ